MGPTFLHNGELVINSSSILGNLGLDCNPPGIEFLVGAKMDSEYIVLPFC